MIKETTNKFGNNEEGKRVYELSTYDRERICQTLYDMMWVIDSLKVTVRPGFYYDYLSSKESDIKMAIKALNEGF